LYFQFTMHPALTIHPIIRYPGTEYWITALLFACLAILAWVKTAYPKKMLLLVREVFTTELSFEEKSITPSSIALFIIFVCCNVLLIMQLIHNYGVKLHVNEAQEIGIIALAILLYYIAKTIVVFISGFIFEQQSNAWEYITEIYVYAHFLGILLLPLMFINIYGTNIDHKLFDEIIVGCIATLLVYRTIKMFILMINKGLRMMYLFLYICALEILPLALFIRYGVMSL
jgi:hypothetical protein